MTHWSPRSIGSTASGGVPCASRENVNFSTVRLGTETVIRSPARVYVAKGSECRPARAPTSGRCRGPAGDALGRVGPRVGRRLPEAGVGFREQDVVGAVGRPAGQGVPCRTSRWSSARLGDQPRPCRRFALSFTISWISVLVLASRSSAASPAGRRARAPRALRRCRDDRDSASAACPVAALCSAAALLGVGDQYAMCYAQLPAAHRPIG
jgi:hypothetical protein